jgi:Tfp pilus assembly protein PilV
MDAFEKFMLVVLIALVVVLLTVLGMASKAAIQNSNSYHQACTDRNGVTVYNGRHYECFVK